MASPVGLQQLMRTQGMEWGDAASGDTHIWIQDHVIYTDAALNLAALSFGSLVLTDAASKITPGGTSLLFRNHADTLTNMSITDGGLFSLTPQSYTASGSASIGLGTTLTTIKVPDDTTSINFVRINQNFQGTTNSPNGNSARPFLIDSHWTDSTNGVGTFSGAYCIAYHDGAGTDVQDLFGCIGRAYITSTGISSVGFWGIRGDLNFEGAGSAVSAVCVYAHSGDQFAGSSITTWSGLKVDQINWNVTTVQDGYGALIGIPASCTGFKIGVSIGQPSSSTAYQAGLVVWSSGVLLKGAVGTTPPADTSTNQAIHIIQSGSNSGTNDVNCLLYFYRNQTNQGYIGFTSNTSNVIAGHTKVVGDLAIAGDGKLLVDSSGQIWSNGKITATTALNVTTTALASGNLPTMMLLASAAHTGLNNTATQEVFISLAQTKTFTGGGADIATMYGVNIGSPTYAASAAQVITKAATLTIQGAPIAGTNMTMGATYALDVRSGISNFVGLVQTAATATGGAGINLPHGTAPTSPVNGDVWTTTAGLFVRVNGSTVGPLS